MNYFSSRLTLIALSLAIFFVQACKKDKGDDNNGGGSNNPPGVKPTLTFIKKFKVISVWTVTTDASNNIYIAGNILAGNADLGGGSVNIGNKKAMFVAKYNGSGAFQWQKLFPEATNLGPGASAQAITLDAEGNILLAGQLVGATSFNGTTNDTAKFGTYPVILKLNSSGDYIWHKVYAASNNSNTNDIATDAQSNVFVSGQFAGVLDGNTAKGIIDGYVIALDKNGVKKWIKTYGRSNDNADDYAPFLHIGKNGALYTTRDFKGTIQGAFNLTATGTGWNAYVAKWAISNGNVTSSQKIGYNNEGVYSAGLAADASGNYYMASSFYNKVDLGNGVISTGAPNIQNPVLIKYNSNGDFLWKRHLPSNAFSNNEDILLLPENYVLLTGKVGGVNGNKIDVGNGPVDADNSKLYWLYWACYDGSGKYIWDIFFRGYESDSRVRSWCVDKQGHIIAVGNFVPEGESPETSVLVKY
jgi:hypothetical protein